MYFRQHGSGKHTDAVIYAEHFYEHNKGADDTPIEELKPEDFIIIPRDDADETQPDNDPEAQTSDTGFLVTLSINELLWMFSYPHRFGFYKGNKAKFNIADVIKEIFYYCDFTIRLNKWLCDHFF